jgi:sugar lactone lactonase YvrE
MSSQPGRYSPTQQLQAVAGWTASRVTPVSRLFGANGMRVGPDGRIYVAQVSGSQISAIDVATGSIEAVSPMGSHIVAPDDIAFDPDGNLYATEITEGRVSIREPNGSTRVIYGDLPVANPITFHQGRLIAGECRMGGRIMELDLNGGAPRVILDNVPMPNAFDVGPDGKLYIPVMGANEIWRVDLGGGAPEKVADSLGVPDSVKFDSRGFMVSTQVHSGEVLRIDPGTGERSVMAHLTPGLDNVVFCQDRVFVSNMTGYITEILGGGRTQDLIADGFNWPLGLAVGHDGTLLIADGAFCYTLRPGEARRIAGMLFIPGYPGYARGIAAAGDGSFIVTTGNGEVTRYSPAESQSQVLASGFDQLYGVAVTANQSIVFVEQGTGRVYALQSERAETLVDGLNNPSGITVTSNDDCYVAESGAGRIVRISRGKSETVLDGLQKPQGIVAYQDVLYVVDAGLKELIEYDPQRRQRRTIASGLPVGAPVGITPKFIGAIGTFCGPMGPFAAIAVDARGTFYLSGDAEGSVISVSRT